MSQRRKWTLTSLLGEKYILNILVALFEGEKRFADLVEACPNEKTRTAKLRKLEESRLIETISQRAGKRFFVHYKITLKGKNIIQEITKLEDQYSLEKNNQENISQD